MDINITTKFSVGDIVYKPMLYNGEWYADKTPYTIFKICVYMKDDIKIAYDISDACGLQPYPENMLCATYEECKQIVNKYNKLLTNNVNVV